MSSSHVCKCIIIFLSLLLYSTSQSQTIEYADNWSDHGFNLNEQSAAGVEIIYSIQEFSFRDINVNGETLKRLEFPGNFLPNNEGAPDLPGFSRYIAIPEGATAVCEITSSSIEKYQNIKIAPAPRIPYVNEKGPLEYNHDLNIYGKDAWYPHDPVKLSEINKIRDVDVALLGITPFQYNPVTKELIVYRDMEIKVSFKGGNGQFGDTFHRNRWFEPVLSDILINYSSLPPIDFDQHNKEHKEEIIDYIIIIPDDPGFKAWADSLCLFRNQQGIVTRCFTTSEVGGNNATAIESFIDNAYYNWNLVGCLLLGDHGSTGNTVSGAWWENTCLSDNIYADVTGNDLPDVIMARMTANDEFEAKTMVTKILNHERFPPTNPGFYNNPVTACAFMHSWWDHLCAEVVGGYFKHVQGKEPVRVNDIYSGTPGATWSQANNTGVVVEYFGPNGVGYIPQTPIELGGWTGGNATMINNAINNGAFMILHRDHGSHEGWGVPNYEVEDIDNLHNIDLCYVLSINCSTGAFGIPEDCFTEKFHGYTFEGLNAGAIGVMAASSLSLTIINDVYTWGIIDNMWPDFMPDVNEPPAPRGLLPAFANAGGKYFLDYSSWPYIQSFNVEIFHLYHHHGGAFMTLYSEVPQHLEVVHEDFIFEGQDTLTVQADSGAFICLSYEGEVIGVADGIGSPVNIAIDPQYPPGAIDIVVTKTNYFRYKSYIHIVPDEGPYIIENDYLIDDGGGNGNGKLDYSEFVTLTLDMKNVGLEDGDNVSVNLSSDNPYLSVSSNTVYYGSIPAGTSSIGEDVFTVEVAVDVPDGNTAVFNVEATNEVETWNSTFSAILHAPILNFVSCSIDDSQGNNNGRLDPCETCILNISVENNGSADSYDVVGNLNTDDPYVQIESDPQEYGTMKPDTTMSRAFTVIVSPLTPLTHDVLFTVDLSAYAGISAQGEFSLTVGHYPILVIKMESYSNPSSLHILEALLSLGLDVELMTSFPDEIGNHSAVFLCLGLNTYNHVLTDDQGQVLADYLEDGGYLYLEGGDTWAFDTHTPVHPWFHINGIFHGGYDLESITGKNNTFTQGFHYDYIGPNILIDYIEPEEGTGAFTIFSNDSPEFDCAIVYQGLNYRTIGSSFEFGGLSEETNTKMELMEKYLNFFQIEKLPGKPHDPIGAIQVCGGSDTNLYSTYSVEVADYYIWSSDPPDAIIPTYSQDTSCYIQWNESFSGTAFLHVSASNSSGIGLESEGLEVNVSSLPIAAIWGSDTICEGDSSEIIIKCTGNGPWIVTVLDSTNSIEISNSPYSLWITPTETMDVEILSVIDNYGCENVGEGVATVHVHQLPDAPETPVGLTEVHSNETPVTEYSILPDTNIVQYAWTIDPADAGGLEMDYADCVITWNPDFIGGAQLHVQGENACGPGPASDVLEINVENSFGVPGVINEPYLTVFPNPSADAVRLRYLIHDIRYLIFDLYGIDGRPIRRIVEENLVPGEHEIEIEMSDLQPGIYFIKMQEGKNTAVRKLVISD